MIEDTVYEGMYRLILPDGSLSILYNKTRAIEYLRLMKIHEDWETIRIGYDTMN